MNAGPIHKPRFDPVLAAPWSGMQPLGLSAWGAITVGALTGSGPDNWQG